jgi:FMN-dependent NADH-azoreductase
MTELLHIVASPRGASSKSTALAEAHIKAIHATDPALSVDTLNLWEETLPAFDGDRAAAKMTFFGEGEMDAAKQTLWDEISTITKRFTDADHYVINMPMWNGGIPYRLKQYIDIITQPGLLFGFAPDTGYSGLLSCKKATVICTSGVWQPGAGAKFGTDFQSNYLSWWLNFIGVEDVQLVRFQPTLLTEDPQAGFDGALAELQEAS